MRRKLGWLPTYVSHSGALRWQKRATLARQVVALRKNRRRTTLQQVAAGLKDSDEKELADMTVDEAEGELRRAISVAEMEKRKLSRLVEPATTFEFSLAMDPELLTVPVSAPGKSELVGRAIRLRADLEAINSNCKQPEFTERLASNDRYLDQLRPGF